MFNYEIIHACLCSTFDPQIMYQLYLCYQIKRLILELKCNTIDQRFFSSAKCLSKYPTSYTHIDIVKSRYYSSYLNTFGDIFDIHTSIDKANEEESDINDHCYNFIHIKDIDQYVFETQPKEKNYV
ncbi:unnamed protein product [Rotaria sordida]|uniref:Uncharacterized protein n=2 Tax=Rotaria sordida TaxID=392033 RepID=A0A819IXQ2_9BILA|nr:unnamed protein product [Rotaria sordida]CAF3918791.1 unnamed protein product [Rotaria sordida]CAF4036410.1 unnamed protein product [Rotaria sordida]